MTGNLSVNCLFDSYPNPEAAQASLFPYLDRAPLSMIQLTSGARKEQAAAFANRVKARYPQMDIIMRIMPDENPPTYQRYTPEQWLNAYAPFSNSGQFILSIGNEAGVGDLGTQNAWYTSVIELAGKRGIRVVTPNIPTHNTFDPAAFDSTYRMLAKYRGWFSCHYYFDNTNGKPIQPVHETVENYCQAHNIPIQIAVTELGYAYKLDAYTGYGNGHLPTTDYGLQLVATATRWPRVNFFVFAWGKQSPFETFNISDDTVLQSQLVAYNRGAQRAAPLPVPIPTPIPTPTEEMVSIPESQYQALLTFKAQFEALKFPI